MKKIIITISISVALLFLLFSCSKPIDYQIQIVNNTLYTIDKLEFGGSISGPVISVPPMSTSEAFHITYDEGFRDVMGDPEYLISITQYSDENGTYNNNMWRFFPLNEANPKTNNVISVQIDPQTFYAYDIFKFFLN
ncbi:MAG: hypothetical protein RBS29_07145 [Bacteroidales bacterium]|jgi:hypothetical protein|nr:hypothetical protein [Bacteroidales bacterium]